MKKIIAQKSASVQYFNLRLNKVTKAFKCNCGLHFSLITATFTQTKTQSHGISASFVNYFITFSNCLIINILTAPFESSHRKNLSLLAATITTNLFDPESVLHLRSGLPGTAQGG